MRRRFARVADELRPGIGQATTIFFGLLPLFAAMGLAAALLYTVGMSGSP